MQQSSCWRLLLLLGVGSLLLLPSVSSKEEPPSTFLHYWRHFTAETDYFAYKGIGGNCSAGVELTLAYALLHDLVHGHKDTGILRWGWPRKKFYQPHLDLLVEEVNKDLGFRRTKTGDDDDDDDDYDYYKDEERPYRKRFCIINDEENLVCLEEGICGDCASLPGTAGEKLKAACAAFGGNGGKDATADEEKLKELPKPKEKSGKCEKGWLKTQWVAWGIHEALTENGGRKGFAGCSFFPELTLAFARLETALAKDDVEKELAGKKEFYEEKLWLLKDGVFEGDDKLCYFERREGWKEEKFVCGTDSLCVECRHVTKEFYGDVLYEACNLKEGPEKYENSCGAERPPPVEVDPEGEGRMTTETSGAVGRSRLAVAAVGLGLLMQIWWREI